MPYFVFVRCIVEMIYSALYFDITWNTAGLMNVGVLDAAFSFVLIPVIVIVLLLPEVFEIHVEVVSIF